MEPCNLQPFAIDTMSSDWYCKEHRSSSPDLDTECRFMQGRETCHAWANGGCTRTATAIIGDGPLVKVCDRHADKAERAGHEVERFSPPA